MSLSLVPSIVWLLATAPVADAPSSGLVLHEGLPEHLEVDGRLDEWAALPSAASTESDKRSEKPFARHTFDPKTGVYDTRRFEQP